MNAQERYELFLSHLRSIVETGGDYNSALAKDRKDGKFLLFAGGRGQKVTIDVPLKEMNPEEQEVFQEQFRDKFKRSTYSYSVETDPDQASRYTEAIFTRVFRKDQNFDVEMVVDLD